MLYRSVSLGDTNNLPCNFTELLVSISADATYLRGTSDGGSVVRDEIIDDRQQTSRRRSAMWRTSSLLHRA